ncbi:hypothetical protein Theco_4012 (plasmid) [Thermobacillus composti KWC4]|jgi:hypothetical protein|uniref:Uncharacterized protein n=1 Tax=Thermobacillus composti (strain DSM 18247 / JCM 13945 / KWC4) TaxID=717605 RepID=L0EJQ6_THECK|nr:hypothetical protein [Thermobacillus composti]AGA60016.1 hypothetical protein Theco_4012 [Thermobacillus composti KWC4]
MHDDAAELLTREEIEEARKEEMRELLIEAFDGKSVLYEIYKKRGWLDRLFTDKILSMDKNALYTSSQVAEICETHDYVIKNKRRELIDYVKPIQMGEGNAKVYKHNYISVFKLKMIHGLTGEGSEYTIPELKELIYGGTTKITSSENARSSESNDLLFQIMKKMEQFEKFHQLIVSGEFFAAVEEKATLAAQKALMPSHQEEVKKEVLELYDKITGPETSIDEKQLLMARFAELESGNPEQRFFIQMYRTAAEDRLNKFKQDERELHIRKVKEKIIDLFEAYENAKSDNERDIIREQLNKITTEHPDLSFEIRYWFSTIGKEKKKKSFWKRIFS